MPLHIISTKFIDEWGNETTFDKSNAGDKLTMEIDVHSQIVMSSANSPFIIDPFSGIITCGDSFFDEGFRVGQTIEGIKYDSTGFPIDIWSATVTYCDGNEIHLTSVLVPDISSQESITLVVVSTNRQYIDCSLNHISNQVQYGEYSLIDGEATRFNFSSLYSMSVGATQNATIVGNQSGQYLLSAEIQRQGDPAPAKTRYIIRATFVNSGIYESEWFDSADCLKVMFKQLWSTQNGEPFGQTEIIYNNNANTGWFDQAHNTSPTNATLSQGVNEIDYAIPTSFTIAVDGILTELGIGSSYIPLNDSYYKNKPLHQGRYGMIIPTSDLSVTTYDSFLNDTGAGYQIKIDDIQVVGTTTFIEVVFIPNGQFQFFMANAEDGDRTFYLWVKCGNLNLLAFSGQLTTSPPVGGELITTNETAFFDHSDNDINIPAIEQTNLFDTEDDLAYLGSFLVENGADLSSLTCIIKAKDTISLNEFTLQQHVFGLSASQVNSSGVTLVDEQLMVNPQLPTTSNKREAFLERNTSIDTSEEYGLRVYYPFILDWRYWIQQQNADVSFYPNQNKNWQNYSENGNWSLFFELDLIKDGLSYTKEIKVIDFNYDNDNNILSTIQLFRYSDMTPLNGMTDDIILVQSTHINLMGGWNTNTWGMHTTENFEGQPRWISSTAIDYDGNSNNPLYPVSGNRSTLNIAGTTAVIKSLCDGSKITQDNSITAKIKNPGDVIPPITWTTSPDDIAWQTTNDEPWTLA